MPILTQPNQQPQVVEIDLGNGDKTRAIQARCLQSLSVATPQLHQSSSRSDGGGNNRLDSAQQSIAIGVAFRTRLIQQGRIARIALLILKQWRDVPLADGQNRSLSNSVQR